MKEQEYFKKAKPIYDKYDLIIKKLERRVLIPSVVALGALGFSFVIYGAEGQLNNESEVYRKYIENQNSLSYLNEQLKKYQELPNYLSYEARKVLEDLDNSSQISGLEKATEIEEERREIIADSPDFWRNVGRYNASFGVGMVLLSLAFLTQFIGSYTIEGFQNRRRKKELKLLEEDL